jgi:hypothetical protein
VFRRRRISTSSRASPFFESPLVTLFFSYLQYSGYGKAGIARRMRVYSLSQYGERIETYKLLDTKERIDQVVLVGEDALGQ